ncbi:MAG: DUF6382 domain-containing protein [Defluviitaleaceae bacterium]|nr:DUF6382 domain-containing protein [Defluviitaleaceae bacterium]
MVHIIENIRSLISHEDRMGKSFINLHLDEVDEIAWRTISYSKPSFIPSISFITINDKKTFSYDITEISKNYITLKEFFEKKSNVGITENLSPKKFTTLMQNLIEAITVSYDYFMNPSNLLLDEEYIFINETTLDISILYFPFKEGKILTEKEINEQVYTIAKRLVGKPVGVSWQPVILRLWDITEKTTLYEAKNIYKDIYNSLPSEELVRKERPEVITALDIIEEVASTRAKKEKKFKKEKPGTKEKRTSILRLGTRKEKKTKGLIFSKKESKLKSDDENIFSEGVLKELEKQDIV